MSDVTKKGITARIRILPANPITPPNLFGMERRIAYANKKYHSGTICGGVTKGLATIKLSGSPRILGENITKVTNPPNKIIKPTVSFTLKYQWKGILFVILETPKGLFLPVLCNKAICNPAIAATINGTTKWKVKNRVRVALLTEYPPHSHITNLSPKYGKALNRLVITVAPQYLICPQGSTYPKNAAAITKNKRPRPESHVDL